MKIFFTILLCGFSLFAQVKPDMEKAKAFAKVFSKEVLTVLEVKENDTMSLDQRMDKFRDFLHKGIAMKSIGKASVGRFWNEASQDEQNEFHKLFENFFVDVYAAHFKSYKVTNIVVTGAKDDDDGDGVWVTTVVSQKDKPDIMLEWKVVQGKTELKIVNVVIDQFLNFSLNLQKAFVEIIANNGGSFAAILKELQEKTTLNDLAQIKKNG